MPPCDKLNRKEKAGKPVRIRRCPPPVQTAAVIARYGPPPAKEHSPAAPDGNVFSRPFSRPQRSPSSGRCRVSPHSFSAFFCPSPPHLPGNPTEELRLLSLPPKKRDREAPARAFTQRCAHPGFVCRIGTDRPVRLRIPHAAISNHRAHPRLAGLPFWANSTRRQPPAGLSPNPQSFQAISAKPR